MVLKHFLSFELILTWKKISVLQDDYYFARLCQDLAPLLILVEIDFFSGRNQKISTWASTRVKGKRDAQKVSKCLKMPTLKCLKSALHCTSNYHKH